MYWHESLPLIPINNLSDQLNAECMRIYMNLNIYPTSISDIMIVPGVYLCVLLAAPNQFASPAIGSQPAVSSNGVPFIPQPMNYAGMPQQYVPANYGFYAPPMMQGAPISAGFPVYSSSQRQLPATSGAPVPQGSSNSGLVGAGTQPAAAAQPAPGSWSMQMPPVVNPFLVSLLTLVSLIAVLCLLLYIFIVAY